MASEGSSQIHFSRADSNLAGQKRHDMRHLPRALESRLLAAAKAFPAVILSGPRRAGKTSLLTHAMTAGSYRLFEDPEVDFVLPAPDGCTRLVEAKAAATVKPEMAAPMQRLAAALFEHSPGRGEPDMYLVHEHSRSSAETRAVAPGVVALPWRDFVTETTLRAGVEPVGGCASGIVAKAN